jgi:hypothetical protein
VSRIRGFALAAHTHLQFAKIRVIQGQLLANKTNPMANGAVRIAGQRRASRLNAR